MLAALAEELSIETKIGLVEATTNRKRGDHFPGHKLQAGIHIVARI